MNLPSQVDPDLFYPESDGKPMADNTKQFRWIVTIKENLEILFATQGDVFIAGDLLWYPIQGDNKTCQAPDAMVVFGRPKGDRRSYKQWEEDWLAPQVVFEILSPCNTKAEMHRKLAFYETHSVEEYYLYDPDRRVLKGWLRQGQQLLPISSIVGWVSPRLGIRFAQPQGELEIYRPDGQKFLTSIELDAAIAQERHRADQERHRADQEQQRANQAESQLANVIRSLLRSGMEKNQVAALTGVEIAQVERFAMQEPPNDE
ncbi:MAG: Uma2 family endonuclease [Synechococcales bacterium]|nr:Uma2 family endonuclease [Synechococcales bacterium]